ncbi:glucose-6-phosphate exchanger SLC37A2 isoform X1 [Nilaparvata lugens]|uniref:glucose-6-phosphate exchanger SLC37A2 isoform X1 n=1 Tax=Nilaparvata lugens TaxID=108931 RepID=UPI000B980CE1|nr:glucose-6-phosphate exchanger SLC37A2 isoform X1 [Nilaparvata lugens]
MSTTNVPFGIKVVQKIAGTCCSSVNFNRNRWFPVSVWILTFLTYTYYHATRKPISVVKTILNRNCTGLVPPPHTNTSDENWCDWKPFDRPDASSLLGALDSSFLFAYAAAMFISGIVAERVNLRYFLTVGMIMSGISCCLMGVARIYNIHSLWYFIGVQVMGGIFQTTGWPGVVTVMGKWFERERRGLIMGIWNSHTSIGNILGTVIASHYLDADWALSFITPGWQMIALAGLVFLFLAPSPKDVGCPEPDRHLQTATAHKRFGAASNGGYRRIPTAGGSLADNEEQDEADSVISSDSDLLTQEENVQRNNEDHPILSNPKERAVGFCGALCIPGVIEYSLCLFFAKLVSYTFLFWLPLYINSSTTLSPKHSADLSTVFDVGGIFGGIVAGIISDSSSMSATTCVVMFVLAIPMLFVYHLYGGDNLMTNGAMLLVAGALVNGPYALITTAVSAELGTHSSLAGNSKALATVTAIIDGTGSIGAAVGPLLAGIVSSSLSWQYVFYMLMLSDLMALLLLIRLMVGEMRRWREAKRVAWNS